MLRITHAADPRDRPILVVEGSLVGPWVAELRRAVEEGDGQTTIDLSGVGFADDDGVAALRLLRRTGVALVKASGFLTALIGTDDGTDPDGERT